MRGVNFVFSTVLLFYISFSLVRLVESKQPIDPISNHIVSISFAETNRKKKEIKKGKTVTTILVRNHRKTVYIHVVVGEKLKKNRKGYPRQWVCPSTRSNLENLVETRGRFTFGTGGSIAKVVTLSSVEM